MRRPSVLAMPQAIEWSLATPITSPRLPSIKPRHRAFLTGHVIPAGAGRSERLDAENGLFIGGVRDSQRFDQPVYGADTTVG